jgi:hypothetical protein
VGEGDQVGEVKKGRRGSAAVVVNLAGNALTHIPPVANPHLVSLSLSPTIDSVVLSLPLSSDGQLPLSSLSLSLRTHSVVPSLSLSLSVPLSVTHPLPTIVSSPCAPQQPSVSAHSSLSTSLRIACTLSLSLPLSRPSSLSLSLEMP